MNDDVSARWQVQMMGDRARGHAFTRALLGLPAHALHVCGDSAAWPLLQKILDETGVLRQRAIRQHSALGGLALASL